MERLRDKNEKRLRKEFYERTVFFIDRETPRDGTSSYGLPVDRAHARLLLWFRTFADY